MGLPCSTFRPVLWSNNGCHETEMKIEQATDNYTIYFTILVQQFTKNCGWESFESMKLNIYQFF